MKDANGAGAHKSWCPFPVLHLQSRDGERKISLEPVLEWIHELSALNSPSGDLDPSIRSQKGSGKYPWGSKFDKGDLGPKPTLVHPFPGGVYCRSLALLSMGNFLCWET